MCFSFARFFGRAKNSLKNALKHYDGIFQNFSSNGLLMGLFCLLSNFQPMLRGQVSERERERDEEKERMHQNND